MRHDSEIKKDVADALLISRRLDPEIARDALARLRAELPCSSPYLKVFVKGGWVTLEGDLEWDRQRAIAEKAVCAVCGVTGISNHISVPSQAMPVEIRGKVKEALKRRAESGDEATRRGTMRSWAARS
jgi:osmotically-inducible protein OsmY